MRNKPNQLLPLLLLITALLATGCATPTRAASKSQVILTCEIPACADLVVTQDGQPARLMASAPFAQPAALSDSSPWKIDTGTPSPDGNWVAYTSISSESGGPVLLQNLQSGNWTNVIQSVNAVLPEGKTAFPEDYLWDVIGWFPDSARLMVGPVDLSFVVIVDVQSFASQVVTFPGGGRGGRMFVNLSPDGQSLLYIGDSASGEQVLSRLDLAGGQSTELLRLPYQEGVISNPRCSPDQAAVAYLVQSGQPEPGLSYAIHLYSSASGQSSLLVDGNLDVTAPVWSPDGRAIAFTRRENTPALRSGEEHSNVWVITLADALQTQVSFESGLVRSPAWAKDSQTLAYVTGDGRVGVASLEQPGKTWQARGASAVPELTNVFFLP